jgi:putative transposase
VFAFIEREKAYHPIALLCRVLSVSSSGYYAWRRRGPSRRALADEHLREQIITIHAESRETYGVPRIHAELCDRGVRCGRKRIARLMRGAGLVGCHRRPYQPTTRRDPARPAAPDLVNRSFVADAPNRLWVADITYVPTWAGFLYLAVVLDAFSRKVVGWAMADNLRTELVLSALEMAVCTRGVRAGAGPIHHSDHGSQYTSLAFGQRCREAGVVPSMGSVGDCYDNALAESFFATLECELLDRQRFKTRIEARLAVFDYLEVFYNRRRRHSALDYRSPAVYEAQHAETQAA